MKYDYARYFFESFRPEIRQYFHEADWEEVPLSREQRNLVTRRAKNLGESLPFGTRRKINEVGYEFLTHSNLGAKHLDIDNCCSVMIGENAPMGLNAKEAVKENPSTN